MRFNPADEKGANLIDAYGDGGFRVRGQALKGHLMVSAVITAPWGVDGIETADMASLEPLFTPDYRPEILLFGCGEQIAPLAADLRRALEARGIGFDLMDTGAAARTFNLLLLERRQVAVALIAVQ